MEMMEYEKQMFLDAFHDDGLLIMARGLGVDRIFVNFLKVYCDASNLVLVLNTSTEEEDYFLEQLEADGVKPLPRVVTAEYSSAERQALYMEGGVLFMTSRILVVDLLTSRAPINLISGILVYKAHRILESCQEAFILRLFRETNKTGFIKAFSDSPQSFTAGFCHVGHVMKSLFLRKLFLWPRFHASVVAHMEKDKVDVVEIHVQMTGNMLACQTALLNLIDACVKELRRCNSTLDTDEISVEYAITKGFDKIVKLHLEPVWHQLSPRTKQIVSDMKMLRNILGYLTQYDSVHFYNVVNSIKVNEKVFGQNSGWLFMDAADSLFVNAKARVFGRAETGKKLKSDSESAAKISKSEEKDLSLEESPKWAALKKILKEIESDLNDPETPEVARGGSILVAVSEERICAQLREYLCDGGDEMLKRLFEKTVAYKTSSATSDKQDSARGSPSKSKKVKSKWHKKIKKSADTITLTQIVSKEEEQLRQAEEMITTGNSVASGQADEADDDDSVSIVTTPVTVLHAFYGSSDPNAFTRALRQLEPCYIVLYDADMAAVRQLEVYKASRPGKPLRVYFLMYTGSTEEQRYLTTLRREKEAFEYLIREKATMVIPEEREGKVVDDPELNRDMAPANATVNSRQGGLQKVAGPQKVIVDMREFRSELPSLIHRRGIDIEPVTLEVGDYILSPEICVERKSLSDLIGSLNNGRLYNQAVAMCRHYKKPVLLIEFDANKPFALQGKYTMTQDINSNDVSSRLTLLTIHFPRLRILWCQSPYSTAQLIEELKTGRPQPDASCALAITNEAESELINTRYSFTPHNMLQKMPGITSKNIYSLMNHVDDLASLIDKTQEELTKILDSDHSARQLYQFLHHKHKPTEAAQNKPSAGTSRRPNFKGVKRKK